VNASTLAAQTLFPDGNYGIEGDRLAFAPRPVSTEEWTSARAAASAKLEAANAVLHRLGEWFVSLPMGVQISFEPARVAVVALLESGDVTLASEIVETFLVPESGEPYRAQVLACFS